jgi:hypothetical protein
MKTEFVRLSDPRLPQEVWIETTFGRWEVKKQFAQDANGVVKCWLVYDSQEGELLEESFRSLYDARGYVNSLVEEAKETNDSKNRD